jgi:hypothetical protein
MPIVRVRGRRVKRFLLDSPCPVDVYPMTEAGSRDVIGEARKSKGPASCNSPGLSRFAPKGT